MTERTFQWALSYTSKMQPRAVGADDLDACYANRAVAQVAQTEGVSALPSTQSRGLADKLGDLASMAVHGAVCSIIMLCGSGAALSVLAVTNTSTCSASADPSGNANLDQGGGVGCIEGGGVGC